ncbi:hypothetical protein [Gallaecimonas xiamenensis]|uniref:Uncharacterized protein n=1 Tax=Gallaecimonas xiamenensis 3-C-1 TaxID=745411 RepID=K2J495_9GAMM|nr:hypothetical protein [Gallaecimonas xiamenensis]EKE77866.1 hypothetical protein B3C1_00360 [Gallaecimonas xiamenensis 3-C-1]
MNSTLSTTLNQRPLSWQEAAKPQGQALPAAESQATLQSQASTSDTLSLSADALAQSKAAKAQQQGLAPSKAISTYQHYAGLKG